MKNKLLIVSVIMFISAGLFAQNCEAYVPTEKGVKYTYKTSNKKGKVQSYYSQELLSKKNEDGGTKFEILHINYDDKKELINQDTLFFYCKGNVFYIDMGSYLNEEQLSNYDESLIEITSDNIGYPSNLKPGTELKDGYVQADINVGMTLTFKTDVINREAEAYEDIATDAGTFKTIRVSEDIVSKIGFITIKMKTISWVKTGIGNIKVENYDKKGNLSSVTELVGIE
ncbi:MAG: hypothetical protein L3J35_09775 [Bacteroidales bacterium]|nr:hypothetical protein [Bacteroidales bacterium]